MKTLSVRQPWAYLICSGIKDVENRSWRILYRGKILIHAPAKFDDRGFLTCYTIEQRDSLKRELPKVNYQGGDHLLSAILGTIEIVDCINDSNSIWAEPDQWHWILKNPGLFDKPILDVPGRLGLWDFDKRTIK